MYAVPPAPFATAWFDQLFSSHASYCIDSCIDCERKAATFASA